MNSNTYRAQTLNAGHINAEHVVFGPDGKVFCRGFESLRAAKHTADSLTHGPAFSEREPTYTPDDEPRHYGNSHW